MRFFMISSLIAVALLAIEANGAINVTASRNYVDSKVYTLQTNMEDRIDHVRPGNYLAVSNNAMKAVQTENDPTVPQWAKNSVKPSYTASEVGALPVDGIAVEAEFANRAGSVYWADVSGVPWWIEDDLAVVANEANYANEAGRVPWSGIEGKPDWIGNSKPEYTASEVGALPANGKAVSAEQSDLAENANNARNAEWAAFARDAENANYASSAGGVFWFNISGTPSWIGDDKPTYTASEVGAAPAKIILVLGGTSSDYDLRLNGVAQTFEQVSNYVAHGEVIAKHLNGFYKPTYISASEIMFDCTGLISGDVSTRRIHMVKTNNKVALDDTKILAQEKWVGTTVTNIVNDYVATNTEVFVSNNLLTISQDGAIKWQESFGGYKMDASSAQTVNCKDHAVTFVTASGENGLTIVPPGANANGESRDFVVYVNTSGTNALDLTAFTTIYASDESNTNAVKEKLTALYFTELSADVWMLGRQELNRVKP